MLLFHRGGSVVRKSFKMDGSIDRNGGREKEASLAVFSCNEEDWKRRDSGADVQHGQLKGSTIHPVAPVPRTEIVTCPLRRRDSNAYAYRPRSSNDERRDKRVPWRGSSGELSSTRVHTRPCLPGETHTYRVFHNQSRSQKRNLLHVQEWNARLYFFVFNWIVVVFFFFFFSLNSMRSSVVSLKTFKFSFDFTQF